MKRFWGLMAMVSLIFLLAGCGGKDGFTVFIIDNQGNPSGISEQLQENLQKKLGEEPKVEIITSAMYDVQKYWLNMQQAATTSLFCLRMI